MSQHTAIPPPWPREIVRVAATPSGVTLYFPLLRGWRAALKLALIGLALCAPSLYAAIAFAPAGKPDLMAMLTFTLTAAVVYPVMLFGAWFVLVALHAAASSLTVEVDANAIRAVRRVLGFRLGVQTLPVKAIAALEPETAAAPRGLGGNTFYRLVALTAAAPAAGNQRTARMVVADRIPDETLLQTIKELIARHAQLDCSRPACKISSAE